MPHDPIRAADTRGWLAKANMDLKAAAHELTAWGSITHLLDNRPPPACLLYRPSGNCLRFKAEAEYEVFRAAQASLPQPVDQHFSKALGELTKIPESTRPRRKPVRKRR